MDALDAAIIRELGVEPFAGWGHRPFGLRATDVAHALGRNVRLVQERITRMEEQGVIGGYACVPNPRHFGMGLTTFHVPTDAAADADAMRALADVDGFVQVIAYLGQGMCLSLSHASVAERDRRIGVVARLAGGAGEPLPMYEHALPTVDRELTPLDWRIIHAFQADAKRPASEAADEVGVTVKTLRARMARMRAEGSIDEVANLDFSRMENVMPFEIVVWAEDREAVLPALLHRLREHYWGHFLGPDPRYSDILLRVFTTTPAQAQDLVAAAARTPGVDRAEAMMGAGQVTDHRWIQEAIAARMG